MPALKRIKCIWVACFLLAAPVAQIHAQPKGEFYRGKTVTIIVGQASPDQHDNEARALSRHMGKSIPGNPTIIVQNMPGAGGLKAALYLAGIVPRDGLVFGIVQRGVFMKPLLGEPGAIFDPTKFNFIGVRASETSLVVLWNGAKVKSVQQAMKEEVVLGSTGGGDGSMLPFLYNGTIGTKFKIVPGYRGGGEINLAMERGEVDGRGGWSLSGLRGTKKEWLAGNKANVILQHAETKSSDLPDVPLAQDLINNDADRALLVAFAKQQGLGFPFFAPPGVSVDKISVLREAFLKTMKDPDYAAEMKSMQAEINPINGEKLDALIRELYQTPRTIVDRAKAILIANGVVLN